MSFRDLLLDSRLSEVSWSECVGPSCRPADNGPKRGFYFLSDAAISTQDYAQDFGLQWTTLYDDYRHDRFTHLDQFLRLGIPPTELEGKVVLDAGCGVGRLSEICLGSADLVIGLDLSDAVREAARLVTSSSFLPIKASGDDIPLVDGSVDVAFCWGVLHHTSSPGRTLGELWRVIKPGGTLAIWVYARNDKYLRRALLAHYFSHLDEREMLEVAEVLTNVAHTLQLTSPGFLSLFSDDLRFGVKNNKEYTRHILYDGLGAYSGPT